MKNEILTICDQLVAAAANGVYQGLIITLLVALCLRLLGRTNAATRHAVWFGTLLLLVALVGAHCVVDSFHLRRVASNEIAPPANSGLAMPSADTAVPREMEAAAATSSFDSADFHDEPPVESEEQSKPKQHPLIAALIQAQRDSVGDVAGPDHPGGVEPDNVDSNDEASAAGIASETTGFHKLMERLLNPISVELAVGSKFPKVASVILLALGLTIAGFRVITLLWQLARIQKLKHQALPPGEELNELFQKLSGRLVTKRKVELKVSPAHRSSFLLGFLRPVVLLPAGERMEPEEAELVLRHELAHLERRDDWVNLVQHFLLAVFFFHPAIWWISRQLSLEREIACDDHVLQQSKRPQTYALVLANLAARMQRKLPLLAPGSSNSKTQLKERIDMILNTHRNASPRLAKTWLALITSTAALAAVGVICAAPRIVLAQIETTTDDAAIAPPADVLPAVVAIDVAPVAPVPGVPPAAADLAPPTPPLPVAVSVGPKFKADSRIALNTSSTVMVAPDVSLAPMTAQVSVIAAGPGQPTLVLAGTEPPVEPKPPRAPRPGRAPGSENTDSSLEERLDRLERLVHSLMNQQGPKGRTDFQPRLEKDGMIDRKDMARIDGFAKQQADLAKQQADNARINPQEIQQIKEQAEREAQQAVEEVKRAMAEVEKARHDQKQEIEQLKVQTGRETRRAAEKAKRAAEEVDMAQKAGQKRVDRKLKADSQTQLETLRRQAEALERQKEKLDREIEQLEQDQEDPDEQDEASANTNSDTQQSESKAECVTASVVASSATP